VMARHWLSPDDAADLGRLDADAIARVKAEAWPEASNADELHDAMVWLGFITDEEARTPNWKGWLAELAKDKRTAKLSTPSRTIWITAERLPQFRAIWPDAPTEPAIAAPGSAAEREWPREEALVEIVRGRLEGLGPATQEALSAPLGLSGGEIAIALAALQTEGFALCGRFTPGIAAVDEWCERRLLARIHHYTVRRLRAEIEPVAARDLLRFLLSWQRVSADTRMEGPEAVEKIVGQLEGFEAPAAAWEAEIMPTRLADYRASWLDDRCRSGRITWARLRPRTNGADSRPTPVRTTPITLLTRRDAPIWASFSGRAEPPKPTRNAQAVLEHIQDHGASFFDELLETRLLRSQIEEGLAELVALGLVTSDSFAGLRALLVPSGERRPAAGARRRRRTAMFGIEDAGRWALTRRAKAQPQNLQTPQAASEAVEHVARALLNRYGVVFWRLLEREAAWLPPWRDLLRVYRRLESRGDIRGGRFVAGFAGEQFALPEAVSMLREVRRKKPDGAWTSVSGADPLNLVGIITPGARLPALTGNRVLYRDGLPVATLAAGEVQFLETLDAATEWEARNALLRRIRKAPSLSPDGVVVSEATTGFLRQPQH
jgi:ATP-dependent helicase Lhr and Lhr-like helicase